ncbi:cytochrome c3 family protein [Opitutus terrae]|uniref:Tetrahaem cytochrome domain-containing protein n=1 Tax=Opitutus terrae (strain DSM 11246 / JCM 15787 / PB90-1) TaxID=452637 RepID=B1ZNU3_OPITP|nr:cytochrome c3 family protein [Opitutus terrae]ACB75463.1 conserved hypothetical protein [Opitutus terrae PB90-1]
MTPKRWLRLLLGIALYGGVFIASTALGGLTYFHFGNPRTTCASCHEMTNVHSDWSASSHASVHCRSCHGGALTLDVHAVESHVQRVVRHFAKEAEPTIRLKPDHVLAVHASCASCHPQAFADWQPSKHATTYARIFLDPAHNAVEPPANDCFRCHGMFFPGDIANLVAPVKDERGWALTRTETGVQPAIPCLTCHQIHAPAATTQIASFYDRREATHVSAQLLPVPHVRRGDTPIRVSRDPRQRICQQCHAPNAAHALGTSDDRTPAGVHEGLSCRDCHWSHTNSAKASCAACHPADSHCGLDVEKMDTTFRSPESRHNIHTVSCADCHPNGVPQRRVIQELAKGN